MEAIKLIGISHNGKLTVDVPKEFDEKEVEIMIISSKDKEQKDEKKIAAIERADKFMKLVGSAKHPEFPMTKYDVYDQ